MDRVADVVASREVVRSIDGLFISVRLVTAFTALPRHEDLRLCALNNTIARGVQVVA